MSSFAILILGIARSGTSALAGTLAHMGIPFGSHLKPADQQNPKGNYENIALSKANQRILSVLGSNWSDHHSLPNNWQENPKIIAEALEIKNLLVAEFSHLKVFGIKDPRLVPLFPLYSRILLQQNILPIVISTLRNKHEVIESIGKSGYYHGNFSFEQGEKLYVHYRKKIEKALAVSNGLEIRFENLLYQTETTLNDIRNFLPSEIHTFLDKAEFAQPAFIDVELHHCKKAILPLKG